MEDIAPTSTDDRPMRVARGRKRTDKETRGTTPVDVQVGRNVRRRRIETGLSQTELATACGITFQQIQKYENGKNRVSASRLWQFAAVFGVDVAYFFDGLGAPAARLKPADGRDRKRETKIDDDTAKLARRIASIGDEHLKKRLKAMLAALTSPAAAK